MPRRSIMRRSEGRGVLILGFGHIRRRKAKMPNRLDILRHPPAYMSEYNTMMNV